ncbi:hypothetical protein LR48_Vigan10g250800 [Vigna angularis]|uniref:Uncharacterized protein n=1 Tax=Phaseolus angularis TaxID=3914 RepID=A0A0L9VNH5_PHAAN|nr:hypothetical protein LR48_Vigan10g250800 [Vigna angularis]
MRSYQGYCMFSKYLPRRRRSRRKEKDERRGGSNQGKWCSGSGAVGTVQWGRCGGAGAAATSTSQMEAPTRQQRRQRHQCRTHLGPLVREKLRRDGECCDREEELQRLRFRNLRGRGTLLKTARKKKTFVW